MLRRAIDDILNCGRRRSEATGERDGEALASSGAMGEVDVALERERRVTLELREGVAALRVGRPIFLATSANAF
jgi:hypothetical protein